MSKLYRVINNENIKGYGVIIGDICILRRDNLDGTAWFYNEDWDEDGVWCLMMEQVEEIVEEV